MKSKYTGTSEKFMLEYEFYNWLLKKGYKQSTVNARKTNCLKVCKYEGDLDIHFEKDSCCTIIDKLSYSTEDESNNHPPRHKIPINGSKRKGTATLKSAVKLYVDFKKSKKVGTLSGNSPTIKKKNKAKVFKRTNPGDVANLYIRNFLCDISENLGGFTEKNEMDTLKYFDYKCPYTDVDLHNINYVHDHLIPHNRQYCGLYIFGNIILTTNEANNRKQAKDFRTFILNDQKIIKGSIEEREKRIKKIEKFVEYSGYNNKINIITILQDICEEKYKLILELCKDNKYEIETMLKTFKVIKYE